MPGYYLIVITVTWKDYHGKRGHFNDRIALCVRGGKGIQPRVRPLPPSVKLRGEPEGFKYRRLSSCQIIFSRQRRRQSWVLTGRGDLDSTSASHSSGQEAKTVNPDAVCASTAYTRLSAPLGYNFNPGWLPARSPAGRLPHIAESRVGTTRSSRAPSKTPAFGGPHGRTEWLLNVQVRPAGPLE